MSDIWKYVNSFTEEAVLPAFEEPVFPMPKNINAEKTMIAILITVEKKELQALCHEYKRKIKKYEQQQAALANLEVHIQETISRPYLQYIIESQTLYEMLTALKQHITSMNRA